MTQPARAAIGIIGGSGLYSMAGLEATREVPLDTPFGSPSDALLIGRIEGREVAFLARHGRNHTILPSEINFRANIFAMKLLGVERIFSASAVGSMREHIHPRDVVVPDQFIDQTRGRVSTFFGAGVAAHVGLADPICPVVSRCLSAAADASGASVHSGGTYVCIEGPAFSTRAESRLYRSWGVDVIGMTNLQEAKLAREAEICYATLALVTDYDCWHESQDDVSVEAVLGHLHANADLAARTLRRAVATIPATRDECACKDALRFALITQQAAIGADARSRLAPLLDRYLKGN